MEESLTSGLNQTVVKEQTSSLLEVEETSDEDRTGEDAIIHKMTQQIIRGRLNDSQSSVTQIGQTENQTMFFTDARQASSPQFYEINEEAEPEPAQDDLLEAVEPSQVLNESPTNADRSDIQLVAIFNAEGQ